MLKHPISASNARKALKQFLLYFSTGALSHTEKTDQASQWFTLFPELQQIHQVGSTITENRSSEYIQGIIWACLTLDLDLDQSIDVFLSRIKNTNSLTVYSNEPESFRIFNLMKLAFGISKNSDSDFEKGANFVRNLLVAHLSADEVRYLYFVAAHEHEGCLPLWLYDDDELQQIWNEFLFTYVAPPYINAPKNMEAVIAAAQLPKLLTN